MSIKLTIEADSELEVLDANKPKPVLWAITYQDAGNPREVYSAYEDLPVAEKALHFHQTKALPDEKPENFKLVALYER